MRTSFVPYSTGPEAGGAFEIERPATGASGARFVTATRQSGWPEAFLGCGETLPTEASWSEPPVTTTVVEDREVYPRPQTRSLLEDSPPNARTVPPVTRSEAPFR